MTFEDYKKQLESLGIKIDKKNEASIKEAFEKIGNEKFEEKKAELEAEIKRLEALKKDAGPKTEPNAEDQETILALKAELESVKDLLSEMKKDRDAALEAQKEKMKKEADKKIAKLKEQGIKEGKLTEASWEEKWKGIAEKDVEQFEVILSGLAVDPHAKKTGDKTGDNDDDKTPYRGPLSGADPTMLEAMDNMAEQI